MINDQDEVKSKLLGECAVILSLLGFKLKEEYIDLLFFLKCLS